MITYTQIAELSEQTSLPLIEIIRALTENDGDSEAAHAALTEEDSGRIDIYERKVAENLATTLVSEGLRFTCEITGSHWRFRIPPDSVSRVRTLGHLSRRIGRGRAFAAGAAALD